MQIIEANSDPHNLKQGQGSPWLLHYHGNSCEVNIGGNLFTTESKGEITQTIPVLIDGIPIISFIREMEIPF